MCCREKMHVWDESHSGPSYGAVTESSVLMNQQLILNKVSLNRSTGTSLVAQWLRIHLPMQGTRVRSLV